MQEIITSLGIDPRQIATTIIGFGIFYWILRRFAFGPFMKLLDDRRASITSTFEHLEGERQENEKVRKHYDDLIGNIEDERHKRLQEGLMEAKKLASEIEAEARRKAELIVRRGEEAVATEKAQAKLELMNYMVDLSIRSAELALRETITSEDHKRLTRRYIEELGAVESGESGRMS